MKNKLLFVVIIITLYACNASKQIAKSAKQDVLDEPALKTAHVGISIFEPATNKYWYNYQGDHYFTPASNTKIPTCYAAMKYLGDSLVGLKYGIPEETWFNKNVIVIQPSGDPTFLHGDYKNQSVFKFLKSALLEKKKIAFYGDSSNVERWGDGWSWNDYQESYMAERSSCPIFGNVISVTLKDTAARLVPNPIYPNLEIEKPFTTGSHYFDSLVNGRFVSLSSGQLKQKYPKLELTRQLASNEFRVQVGKSEFKSATFPFVTDDWSTAFRVLEDTLETEFTQVEPTNENGKYVWDSNYGDISIFHIKTWHAIHSQPTDSVLKPMMHRSDNFFAEQCLLMVSNELLGVMNDEKIIDTLLKTDFKDLPQKPRWADGSGLSRYNLFSPQDFVFILNKMKNDFGMERIKNILPTGSEGTLSNYYLPEKGYIFAKTGSLSGVVTISGFLYTKKNKLLIFSVLVNNHNGSATEIRRAVEKFMEGVRNNY